MTEIEYRDRTVKGLEDLVRLSWEKNKILEQIRVELMREDAKKMVAE